MNTPSPTVTKKPAGLYVHIPFCVSRCGYCTFTSTLHDSAAIDKYLEALRVEIQSYQYFSDNFHPESLFIGGGTPSCLTLGQLDTLFSFLPMPVGGEATCEINPDSCDRGKLLLLRDHGINRISFGVQTFDPEGLRLLERRHNAATACAMVESALDCGFASVSLDLIHGWPGQSEDIVYSDIEKSNKLGIHHISNYTLIVDSAASAHDRYRKLLGGDQVDDIVGKRYWEKIEQYLESKGFTHYETSNFSLPGHQCRHNVAIWRGGEYLGVGLGACSHIDGERYGNTTDLGLYLQNSSNPRAVVEYRERLGPEEKARECAVFWLRLFEGIELEAFRNKTGYDLYKLYDGVLSGLFAQNILEEHDGHVRVAKRYQPVLDSVLEYLV